MMPRAMRRLGWREWHLAAAFVLVVAAVVLTRDAWVDILRTAAADEECSHIFLVPIVAAWMAWTRRIRLRTCRPTGRMVGPVLIAAGWGLSSLSLAVGRQSLWHGGAVLIVVGAALTVLGTPVLLRLLPAFLVLGFLVPVPTYLRQSVALPLQTATAATTQALLQVVGVPVDRAANVMVINGLEVAVVEACNGLRMVSALVLVAYAFAFGLPLRPLARVTVLAASPFAAIACNVARLVPTVLLYGYAPREWAATFHHLSGWIMLPLAFLLLLAMIAALRKAAVPVTRFALAYQ
jgi:exosortase